MICPLFLSTIYFLLVIQAFPLPVHVFIHSGIVLIFDVSGYTFYFIYW